MNTKKTRLKKAEQALKAAQKNRVKAVTTLQIKYVNYRAGVDSNIPEPKDAIPIRHIDMTLTNKGDER